jgi:hypothetical protein
LLCLCAGEPGRDGAGAERHLQQHLGVHHPGIALGSLIGAWVSSATKVFMTEVVYGDRSQATAAVKYIALLVCFLASLTCFIHSARFTFCFHGSNGFNSDQQV